MSWLPALRTPRLTRAVTTVADSAADVLHPLLVIARGLIRLGHSARDGWSRTPSDRRGPAVFLGAACALVIALTPYGPWWALGVLVLTAAWKGREHTPEEDAGPNEEQRDKLQALYDALAPTFCAEDDPHPHPLYTPDGQWEQAFTAHEFTTNGRLARLEMRYPPYFPDEDTTSRTKIQRILTTKAGRDREYRFDWHEEHNQLHMSVRAPLPQGIPTQHFPTAPTEIILGFTDPESTDRTLPIHHNGQTHHLSPIIWRTGPHTTSPHLLALGTPGAGTTNLLRSLATQALEHNNLIIIDATGSDAYNDLGNHPNILTIETTPTGAHTALEWAHHETQRRLHTHTSPTHTTRTPHKPLWIIIDQPTLLNQPTTTHHPPNPQHLLELPLHHGKHTHITIALADHLHPQPHHDHTTNHTIPKLTHTIHTHTPTRILLGTTHPTHLTTTLKQPPTTHHQPHTPTHHPHHLPPGHGYTHHHNTPTHRITTPHTPTHPQHPTTN